jgi:hypothetical protein
MRDRGLTDFQIVANVAVSLSELQQLCDLALTSRQYMTEDVVAGLPFGAEVRKG